MARLASAVACPAIVIQTPRGGVLRDVLVTGIVMEYVCVCVCVEGGGNRDVECVCVKTETFNVSGHSVRCCGLVVSVFLPSSQDVQSASIVRCFIECC